MSEPREARAPERCLSADERRDDAHGSGHESLAVTVSSELNSSAARGSLFWGLTHPAAEDSSWLVQPAEES